MTHGSEFMKPQFLEDWISRNPKLRKHVEYNSAFWKCGFHEMWYSNDVVKSRHPNFGHREKQSCAKQTSLESNITGPCVYIEGGHTYIGDCERLKEQKCCNSCSTHCRNSMLCKCRSFRKTTLRGCNDYLTWTAPGSEATDVQVLCELRRSYIGHWCMSKPPEADRSWARQGPWGRWRLSPSASHVTCDRGICTQLLLSQHCKPRILNSERISSRKAVQDNSKPHWN